MKRGAKWFRALAQAALGLGLLAWLIARMEHQSDMLDAFLRAAGSPGWVMAALMVVFLSFLICTLRWCFLLRFLGFTVRFRTALLYYLVGQFFNAFMLGATGGDIAKAAAIAGRSPGRRTEAATSVLVDRGIGLVALAFLATLVTLLQWRQLVASPAARAIVLLAASAAVCGGVVVIAAGRPQFSRIVEWLAGRFASARSGDMVRRGGGALHQIMRHPRTFVVAFVLSLLNHLAIGVCAWCLGRAIGIAPVAAVAGGNAGVHELGVYLTIAPLINLVATVPLTPSGIGTREAASVALLGLPAYAVPASEAVSLGLLLFAVASIWSLISGGIYLVSRFIPRVAGGIDPRGGDHGPP